MHGRGLCTAPRLLLRHRTVARRLRGSIAEARDPLLSSFARLWQAHDVGRPTFTSDVLRRLAVTSIEQCVCLRESAAGADLILVIIDTSVSIALPVCSRASSFTSATTLGLPLGLLGSSGATSGATLCRFRERTDSRQYLHQGDLGRASL